jgi:glucose-1-phosphate thymidylyltransferase
VVLNKAVVLAQTRGDGLCGAARNHPGVRLPSPPFVSLANRCLLQHALEWLAAAQVQAAVVVVPEAMASEARRAAGPPRSDIAIEWLEQLPSESPADTLTAVAGFLEGEPFVLHLADSLAKDALASLMSDRSVEDLDALVLVQDDAAHERDRVIDIGLRLERGDPRLHLRRGVPAGVAVLGAGALQAMSALDPAEALGLEHVVARLRELGGKVRTCQVRKWWRFKGGAPALLAGNRFALEQLRPDFESARVVNSDIQGAVVAHASARIESSTVRGPAIIGPDAHMREAYVGPYTSIGARVRIEGAEIEHSVILDGASITHLMDRLEACVVGSNARIFRDFRLPRALRLQVGEGATISLT